MRYYTFKNLEDLSNFIKESVLLSLASTFSVDAKNTAAYIFQSEELGKLDVLATKYNGENSKIKKLFEDMVSFTKEEAKRHGEAIASFFK